MLPARLVDRIRLLQWALPVVLLLMVALNQIGPANYVHEVYGEWAHYGLEILFYGTTGPLVMWFTLRTVRKWVEQKDQAEAEVYRLNVELNKRIEERTRLLQQIINAQEDERKRIARELHDDFAQTLTALTINLETALQSLPSSMTLLKDHMVRVQDLTSATLDQTHRWIQDLRPRVLDDLGLVPAVRWYATSRLEAMGVEAKLNLVSLHWRLLPELETALFRTIQEGLNNIVQHSKAKHVLVELTSNDSRIIAVIEDDGVGFNQQELQGVHDGMRGIGLLGMRERISLLGGLFEITSAPSGGTRIHIEVPWTA